MRGDAEGRAAVLGCVADALVAMPADDPEAAFRYARSCGCRLCRHCGLLRTYATGHVHDLPTLPIHLTHCSPRLTILGHGCIRHGTNTCILPGATLQPCKYLYPAYWCAQVMCNVGMCMLQQPPSTH